jgi:hypothetical protein
MHGAAMTLRSHLPRHSESGAPLPAAGREATKEAVTPAPKVAPLPGQISILFRTLAMACVNFLTTTPIGLTGAFRPVLGRKTNSPLDPFRFGGFFHTCLMFLTDGLTNDRYLVDTGATLSIVPYNENSSPSGPLLKGADGQPIPS